MAKKTNIEVNGTKYFRVTRTIGYKSDGTPIRKQFYGSGVNEAIARLKISKISLINIQTYYNSLSKTKTFSQVNTLNSVLKVFFNWCIDNRIYLKKPLP